MSPSHVFQVIATSLVILVLAGVVLFGANVPVFSSGIVTLTGVLGLAAFSHPKLPSPPVWGIVACMVPVMVWAVVQAWPLPAQWESLAHPLWQSAAALLPQMGHSISLAPTDSFAVLSHFMGYGLVFVLAAAVGQRQSSSRILLAGLAGGGTLICLYGLIIYLAGNNYVLWLPKTSYTDSLTATFINRNTYATFAGVVVLLNLCMYLHRVGEVPSPSRAGLNQRLRMLVGLTAPRVWWGIAALAVFVTLVLSNSRAGLASTLVGIGIVWLALYGSVKGARPALWGSALAGLVLVLVLLSIIGPAVLERMEALEKDASIRSSLFAVTYNILQSAPWQGIGLGGFEETFRTVRDLRVPFWANTRIDHAHNSWLELFTEVGVPAAIFLVMGVLLLLVGYVKGVENRKRGVIYPATGLGVLVLVAMHALADFSPNIPGFSLFAAAVLGLLLAQSVSHAAEPPELKFWQRGIGLAVALAAIGIGSWSTAANARAYHAEALATGLKLDNTFSDAAIEDARQSFLAAAAIYPEASWYNDAAMLAMHQAQQLAKSQGRQSPAVRQKLEQAQQSLEATLRLSPANPYAWYRFAQVTARLSGDRSKAAKAMMMSYYSSPLEPNMAWPRVVMTLRYWRELLPEEQDYAVYAANNLWVAKPYRLWNTVKDIEGGPDWLAYVVSTSPTPDMESKWQKVTRKPWPYSATVPASKTGL